MWRKTSMSGATGTSRRTSAAGAASMRRKTSPPGATSMRRKTSPPGATTMRRKPGGAVANNTSVRPSPPGAPSTSSRSSTPRHLSVIEDDGQEDSEESGPYMARGHLRADMVGLGADRGLGFLPEVVPRPVPPYILEQRGKKSAMLAEVTLKIPDRKRGGRTSRKEQKEKDHKAEKDKDASKPTVPRPPSEVPGAAVQPTYPLPEKSPYFTFFVKDNKFEYFAPCIQVTQEDADDDRTVTEMYIRGWKVDKAMMEVFLECWPTLPLLHTVHLWNTGLAADTLPLLSSFLPLCKHLHTLVLDGNTLTDLQLSDLLGEDSRLVHLSLRFCCLTDIEAAGLADALGIFSGINASLVTLDLSNNRIGDVGMAALARGLFFNRSLLVLSLASNRLGDDGAQRLAEALSWFPIRGPLIMTRRRLIHQQLHEVHDPLSCDSSANDSSTCDSSDACRDGSKKRRSSKLPSFSRASPGDKAGKEGAEGRQKKMSSSGKKIGRKRFNSLNRKLPAPMAIPHFRPEDECFHRPGRFSKDDPAVASCGPHHPLLQCGYVHDGELWLPGNRLLMSLNLSRNEIGERGLRALLEAVQDMALFFDSRPGLYRLMLARNAFPPDCPAFRRLHHLMALRDPRFRSARIDLGKAALSPCAMPVHLFF